MEFNKCSRCGNFYVSEGSVCPNCASKDALEYSTFKNYVEENGLTDSLDTIAGETGISVKNINRFLGSEEFKSYENNIDKNSKFGFTGITFN